MRVLVLYRPGSEFSRRVENFAQEFSRQYRDKKLELINIDSRDGAAMASLYDIMQQPAVLALTDSGQVLRQWQGEQMPLLNEVSYYATS